MSNGDRTPRAPAPLPGGSRGKASPARPGLAFGPRLLGWGLMLALAWGSPVARSAPLLSTNAPPSLAVPDASFSVIRVFGALALVLALFLAGVWLFKNWQRLALPRGQTTRLQVIEARSLGGKHVLYVVGYQQERLLLAASPSGVTLVSHLPAAEAADIEPAQVGAPNFVQVLQRAVQGKP